MKSMSSITMLIFYDPRRWEGLNSDEIKLLVEKGHKRDNYIVNGPYDKHKRRFSSALYTRTLSNLEKCNRPWLVYSIEVDMIFCFCCKVFRKGLPNGNLDGEVRAIKERKRLWIQVLLRIVALVKFLAKNNLPFRGTKEKLYQKGNGNFLGLVDMLEEFDPVIKENVRRIINDVVHVHYIGHNIQNELIFMITQEIKKEIIKQIFIQSSWIAL
ncbi:uncharacterized protein LOC143624306 [Bidens hawaiensis]|uniref:uncharacterized protein LOC143624306 n=1 Tax=Bidens hawaiensis TaxID=980011 RepID=UPI00404A74FA